MTYSKNEAVTRSNRKEEDIKKELFTKKCLELHPNYHSMKLRDRIKIRREVENILGFTA